MGSSFEAVKLFGLRYIVFIDVLVAILWLYWLFSGGLAFLGKLLSILASPEQLFNLHWGTPWVTSHVVAALGFLLALCATVFLLWKLHAKASRREK